MQEVKIIDIDNVQWNMKDQEARNKNANLEQKVDEQVGNITNEITLLNNAVKGGAIIVVQSIGLANQYTRLDGFGININLRSIPKKIFDNDGTVKELEGIELKNYGVSNGITILILGDVRNQFTKGSIHLMY